MAPRGFQKVFYEEYDEFGNRIAKWFQFERKPSCAKCRDTGIVLRSWDNQKCDCDVPKRTEYEVYQDILRRSSSGEDIKEKRTRRPKMNV